jgi:hypothetical protein
MTVAAPPKSHGILFKAPMVRALLNTRPNVWPPEPIDPALPCKGQTRRIIKPQPPTDAGGLLECDGGTHWMDYPIWAAENPNNLDLRNEFKCPHPVGTKLWVKENFYIDHVDYLYGPLPKNRPAEISDDMIIYPADAKNPNLSWCCQLIPECSCAEIGKPAMRSGMLMNRWASRIGLLSKTVRVERAQGISDADAIMEGFASVGAFADLWVEINGQKSWDENPWVFVYEIPRTK